MIIATKFLKSNSLSLSFSTIAKFLLSVQIGRLEFSFPSSSSFFFNYYRGERSLERLSRGGRAATKNFTDEETKKSALRRRVVTKREEKGKGKKGKGGKKREIEREREAWIRRN